jgi:hypothetical protein
MATFTDIKKNADGPVITFEDTGTPTGHWVATTLILGLTFFYLLEGQKDDLNSEIKGHVVIATTHARTTADAYANGGLIGGTYLGKVSSYEETFAQMVKLYPSDRFAS